MGGFDDESCGLRAASGRVQRRRDAQHGPRRSHARGLRPGRVRARTRAPRLANQLRLEAPRGATFALAAGDGAVSAEQVRRAAVRQASLAPSPSTPVALLATVQDRVPRPAARVTAIVTGMAPRPSALAGARPRGTRAPRRRPRRATGRSRRGRGPPRRGHRRGAGPPGTAHTTTPTRRSAGSCRWRWQATTARRSPA